MVDWGLHHQHHDHDHHQQKQQQQLQHGWRKGPWTPEEDKLLTEYVTLHGEGRWSSVAKCAGLNRSGKSCRLRWVNYLRPGLKRGQITPQEEGIIIELHALWGNKWSTIARYLPGRTDNEIKNYWRTHFKKKDKSLSSSKQDKIKRSQPRKQQLLQSQTQTQPQTHTSYDQDVGIKAMNHEQDVTPFMMYPSSNNIITTTTATETATATTTAAEVVMEDQYNDMSHYTTTIAPCSSDQSMVDEGYLWGSLWNLDDNPHGCFGPGGNGNSNGNGNGNGNGNVNRVSNGDAQSIQGLSSCGSGDFSYSAFYTGGFIF